MSKNKYICPICQGSIQSRTGMFHTCAICKKQSITLRRGSPVSDVIAKKNFSDIIQRRQEAINSLEVCRQTEPELEIAVKTVFNNGDNIDGFIITVYGSTYNHYLEESEVQFFSADILSSSLQPSGEVQTGF